MKHSTELERLIRAERNVRWAEREVGENWAAVRQAVRSGRKALPIAIAPLALGLPPLIAKAAVLALAVGTSAGATYLAYRATEQPAPPSVVSTPMRHAAPPRISRGVHPTTPRTTEPSAAPIPEPLRVEVASRQGAPTSLATTLASAEPPSDSLKEELTLLRDAKKCLDRRDFVGARGALREHATRFPVGVVADERQALEFILACSEGGGGAAASRAKRYVATHPRSIHREGIARACGFGVEATQQAPRTSVQPSAQPAALGTSEPEGRSGAQDPEAQGDPREPPTGAFPIDG